MNADDRLKHDLSAVRVMALAQGRVDLVADALVLDAQVRGIDLNRLESALIAELATASTGLTAHIKKDVSIWES